MPIFIWDQSSLFWSLVIVFFTHKVQVSGSQVLGDILPRWLNLQIICELLQLVCIANSFCHFLPFIFWNNLLYVPKKETNMISLQLQEQQLVPLEGITTLLAIWKLSFVQFVWVSNCFALQKGIIVVSLGTNPVLFTIWPCELQLLWTQINNCDCKAFILIGLGKFDLFPLSLCHFVNKVCSKWD